MKDAWQVFFLPNVPIWQYAGHIKILPTDSGPIPVLNCTLVQQGPGGLLELTVLDEAKSLELTFLASPNHVLTAVRLRERPELGFAPTLLSTLAQAVKPVLPES